MMNVGATPMPASYAIDKRRRLVITTASACVTFAEAKTHQDQLLSDPDFHPDFNQLVDCTAVTELTLSAEEARIIISRKVFSSSSRRAFVSANPAVFGMGRLMEAYNDMTVAPSQVRVFRDLASARKWLGLEEAASATS